MKKRIKRVGVVFSFLLSCTLALPVQAAPSGEFMERTQTYTASSMQACREQAEQEFPEHMEENGVKYTRFNIEYTLFEERFLDKKEKTVQGTEEPKQTITEDGIEYTLTDVKKEEKTVEQAVTQQVTAYDDYDYAVTAADVPSSKTVAAVNETTGQTEQVICNFSGIVLAGTETLENTMTVTFSNYDAAYYEWNGNYIPRNDVTPPLSGYESQLLQSAGAAEGSVVTGYAWAGEPYNVDGVLYRDAYATVQQQVQMYRANYIGEIVRPEKKETSYQATYEAPDKQGEAEYIMQATAVYQKEKTSYTPYIVAGVGIALLAGLAAMILVVLSKKKEEKGNE